MKLRKRITTWVAAVLALTLGLGGLGLTQAYAAAGDAPAHSKNLVDNGDGTYTLSLDVVGDSEKKPNNVNVIVIVDTSGSMTRQRMTAAKNAVNSLANSLYAYNTQSEPDTVEMALVRFATSSSVAQQPTSTAATFRTAVNNLGNTGDGGTNWESALQTANGIDFGDDDQTFAVFVSDGNPTFRTTQNGWNDWTGYPYNQWGSGYEDATNIYRCYTTAVDDAQALATKVTPANFFTIGAFGNVDRMEQLTDDAGSDSSTNYYNASDTAALNQAIADILAKIEMSGIANADITDGTTNKVVTSSGTVSLINVVPNSFKYYRSGGTYGNMQPWADAPEAQLVDGEVEWNLDEVGVLENGVKYTVTFDVYPSQTALDYAARLDNGEAYDDVVPAEAQQYFDANGSLATNTKATLAYDDTRTDDAEQPIDYTNPPKVTTSASTMTVTKTWEGAEPPAGNLDLIVEADGTEFADVTLNADGGWESEVYISYGIIKGGEVLANAEGHDFSFAELPSVQYRWELDAPTVHPMIIDGTPTMLVKQDADHQAPAGATTYTIKGATYYVDAAVANLTATNYRRSNLNLTKVVTGEGAPEDATFPFTLTVNNAKAAGGSADDTSSDYYVWFSITDKSGIVKDATVEGATPEAGDTGYYYAPSGSPITVEMQAGWNLRFTNLPSGTTYAFAEATTDGFKFVSAENTGEADSTFKGGETSTGTIENAGAKSYTVTYTNEYALVDVTATKVWNDASDQDGIRPETLDLTLNGLPSGTTAPTPEITKSEDGNTWTYTWKGVPKYDSEGNAITYTVTEKNVPEDYTCETTTVAAGGTIYNVHTPEETAVKVTKVWDDANNQDGKRPESVSVQLKADGENYGEAVTLNANGNWTYTWEKLPVNRAGEAIAYTVEETTVPTGYTAAVTGEAATGYTITNSYTPEVTELTVTKVWDDASDQDGIRPDSVAFTVTGDDGKTYDATLEGEGDTWTATIQNVAKYHDGGTEVTFTVDEAEVANYTKSIDNSTLTITNSYTTKVTEATVTKVWDDADNQDGIRPGELKVTLSNGTEVTLNAENNWTATVNNLPMYKDGGQLITYTWNEGTLPEGYKLTNTSTEGTVTTLTNSHTPEETEATVKKVWSDADNQDGIRPASLEVTLSNGTKVTLSDSNEWTATVSKLPKYAAGQEIAYTWTEASVDSYTLTSTDKQGTVTTLTNSHTPEETEATVKKVWDDADNQDGYRPGSITVTLSDGQTVTLSEENDWTATITGLPKYAAGEEIKYTWTEADIEHYTLSDSKAEGTVTTLTNSHTPEVVNVSVEKVWEDAENQDGIRPESVQVQLKANDVATGDPVTLDASNEWAYTWENLDKKAAGEDIAYTVEEVEVPEGYDDETTGTQAEGYLVTNVHEPETTEITVSKVWDDADDQDGYRPASVTVNLYADGEATGKSVALNEGNNWTNTFTDLFVNKPGEVGQAITYSIDENKVEQYTVAIDGDAATGFTVTNSHTPEKTEVPVTKVWDDADNQDGIRPATITVALLANGEQAATAELSADNEWSYTFTDLDKKAAGKDIAYTVAEVSVEGYTSETTGTAAEGYTITNRHTPEVTDVPVTKVWDDADDQDGIRLADVVVKLLADGTDTGKTVTLNEANGWKATFTGVDMYAAGAEIAYTVAEDAPAGYQVAITGDAAAGYTVTNSHTPELTEVKVTKVWSDADDQDGIRPADVTVKLLADGADTGKTVTLSADNEWADTFTGLDKYAAGELVKYTVEENPVADYAVAIAGDAAEGFTVTNSHTPGTTAVNVKKVWDDGNNHDGIRPASVTVELLADGKATGKTVTLDESNGWTGSFADLQKNAAGKAIKYTVEEKAVEGYTAKISGSAADGFTVTNYHKVAEAIMIDPPVQKVIKVPVGTKPAAATFTFQMKAVTEGAPMPEGSVNGVKTMTIEGAGSKEFGEAWIDMPGTYVYEITEVKGDAKGYTYDTTAYTLTVEVTKNADGDLVKTETITDASGKKVEKVVFTNTFTPEPPALPQTSDDSVPASTLVVTALTGVALVAAGSALRLRRNED